MNKLFPFEKNLLVTHSEAENGSDPVNINKESNRFLEILAGGDNYTFQTFADSKSSDKNLVRTLHGTHDMHRRQLQLLNSKGAGVFVCINITDGAGRKAENVVSVRGLVADFDLKDHDRINKLKENLSDFLPTIIVESSPGKHHFYWLTHQPGELNLEEFKPLQKALCQWLKSDPSVCDLPRVMRLPGYIHAKDKGAFFKTRIIHEGSPLSGEQIRETLLPYFTQERPPRAKASAMSDARSATNRAICSILSATEGNRNNTLNREAYILFSLAKTGTLSEKDTREALTKAARESGLGLDEIEITIESAFRAAKPRELSYSQQKSTMGQKKSKEGNGDAQTQTDLIIAFVQSRNDLFHDDNKTAYARHQETGEVRALKGRSFRYWLTSEFYTEYEKAARDQSIREACMTLEGVAMRQHRQVHTRISGANSQYWLDLGKPGSSRCINLQAGKWSIEEHSSVMFSRSDSSQSLPDPLPNGEFNLLWRIANVPFESRLVVVAWLVECLRPDTPFPVVELLGEHGSAKSTAQTALRRLIDPNAADLRGVPKSAEDLFVAGGVNHFISIENVSHLPASLQDAMCVVATGGGFAKRKLYTDSEESVITLKRPIILNGICAAVTQQDLVSRTLTIELPVIESAQSKDKLENEFEANRASIFGGLLDIAAKALQFLPDMQLPATERPRLLEFAYLGMAVAKAMGAPPASFMQQFNSARQEGLERTLDASPVATAIRDWAEIHSGEIRDLPVGQWLNVLEDFKPRGCESWPKSAKGLGDAMRRAAPALRQISITCKSLGNVGGKVKWRIGLEKSMN
ncbi:DNA-primase RepB domain-containing protein [Vreelandella sedimenti]|uniref:DNA-primase RepB domain-containing protein n=1 Tax=Vreelandella sedimenti TaxID=2729618 RepID=UPI00257B2F0E|nr:DNA-primase RepB domain-containing protein [Halomonas sp. UBA3173]|tara:strand:+ start:20887 stop:23304 length:2418 start_codon:yes stop_codon:yes gene_type:complete